MRLFNENRGSLLATNLQLAETFWKRLRGLLGTSGLAEDQALLIRPCNSVHMFGMRYSIDLIFADESDVVIEIVESLAPWRMKSCWRAAYVVELPCGSIRSSGTLVGDTIKVV